ncbi:hypothetical protein HNY73_006463 [Argiope bruennichi]|uniref:Uncharacterized protein n=1 Tax=Argiope bruennichi TaxID=94029 RepID=A0A8T0FM87_ARGBR|nr:hypothetical protein HNY73_006463 [Argiope bruennichi]
MSNSRDDDTDDFEYVGVSESGSKDFESMPDDFQSDNDASEDEDDTTSSRVWFKLSTITPNPQPSRFPFLGESRHHIYNEK